MLKYLSARSVPNFKARSMQIIGTQNGQVRKSIVDETLPVGSFTNMFKALVRKASMSVGHNRKVVDMVKDVINRVPIYWAANFVVCTYQD